MNVSQRKIEEARSVIKKHSGVMRTKDILSHGIHCRTLYAMVESGMFERLSRGLYKLTDQPLLGNPDIVTVAKKVPDGVICLISALAFHNITTQIPHEIYLAIARGSWTPKVEYPPIKTFRFPSKAFDEGIEEHEVDGFPVRVYCPEKTLVDCFKYRNKIGFETAIEALKLYKERKKIRLQEIMRYAKICRMQKVMKPYLEALL